MNRKNKIEQLFHLNRKKLENKNKIKYENKNRKNKINNKKYLFSYDEYLFMCGSPYRKFLIFLCRSFHHEFSI
jgi:hypothetical protein